MTSMRLRDLFQKTDSGVWAAEDNDRGVSILRSTNFTDDGGLDLTRVTLRAVGERDSETKKLAPGDILLEKSGGGPKQPVGRVAMFMGDQQTHVFGNFIARLRTNPEICVSRYAFYLLRRMHEVGITTHYQKQTTGIRNLEIRRYLDREVTLPPLAEQRRIVDILDRAASIRRLRQQAQDTARLIIPALFNKMFGDPATNPMGWPVATLGELGTLERGRSRHRPRNDPALLGGPYPLVQTGEVTAAEWFITDHKATYSEMGLAQSRLWPKGTLCITIAANIANSGLLSFDACFPDSVVAFQPRSRVTTFYAKACLDFLREGIDRVAPKLAQKNINLEILSQVPFPVPPLDLQETFGAQVMAILRIQNRMSDAGVAAEDIAKALAMRLLA